MITKKKSMDTHKYITLVDLVLSSPVYRPLSYFLVYFVFVSPVCLQPTLVGTCPDYLGESSTPFSAVFYP